jgi:hypothetical protein
MVSSAAPPPVPAATGELPPLAHPYRPRRQRTCLFGKLVFGEGAFLPAHAFTLDCSIHDLSEGGAKIMLKQFQTLQPELYLIVVKYCIAYRANVVWQKFPARGLKFSKTYFLNATLPEESNVLRHLWLGLSSRSGGRFD